MNRDQKASIYATAMHHYLFSGDFHIDEADLIETLQDDSIEAIQEAYSLINSKEFQERVRQSVGVLLDATDQLSQSLADMEEGEEVDMSIQPSPETSSNGNGLYGTQNGHYT